MNNNDAIKGSELYLKNHGFDLGKLSQCSSADEIDAIISSTVSKKDAPLFKAIINKSFVPNDDGSFRPFYETNPRTAGDSAEWFDFFRSYGNGTELKKEVHFDLSNHKGRKMNFLGYDEEITNDFRASDLVQQGADSNIHIENKVGVWGNNLRPRIRQELYADALRLDNDPTSKQEYRIYVNAANGKCLFDDSEQASYLKTMLERYPDRCTVKFNDIKLSPNDIETIISKKEHGVLAKDICKNVLDTPAKEVSRFQKSSLGRASSHTGKLFGGIGAMKSASGSSVNWGKIITSIIAVLVVLALIVGVVVLLAKVLPPVFEAIGNFFATIGRAIGNFFSSIGQFFANIWKGIVGFFTGPTPDIDIDMPNLGDLGDDVGNILDGFKPELNKYELEFATADGGATYYVSNCKRTLLGTADTNIQIEIPETYNGNPVVGIGEKAFMYMSHIKALKIPSSIKWIEYNAFGVSYSHCAYIKELHITDIKAWLSIEFGPNSGEYAILEYGHPFCGVGEEYREDYETTGKEAGKFYLNGELVTNLIIPDGVTEIGELAFLNCSSIETITIPSSVTHIGDNAFYGCINLESITFGGTQNEWNKCSGEYLFSYPCTIKCKDGNILITVE